MTGVFISYRRSDSSNIAARLYERLTQDLGSEHVFMDIDSIPPGQNFHAYVAERLKGVQVVLIVIGNTWATVRKNNRFIGSSTRLSDSKDLVRIEVEEALRSNCVVIPILVDDAKMPGLSDIPKSMHSLLSLNAMNVNAGRDFSTHAARLTSHINEIIDRKRPKTCLVVSAFGAKLPLAQKTIDFEEIFHRLISPALAAVNYSTFRNDYEHLEITTEGLQRLADSDLAIFDFSLPVLSMYYLLGVRHSLQRKAALLIRHKSSSEPLDSPLLDYFVYGSDNEQSFENQLDRDRRRLIEQVRFCERKESSVYLALPNLRVVKR